MSAAAFFHGGVGGRFDLGSKGASDAFFWRGGGRFDFGFGCGRGVLRSPRSERRCFFFHGGVGGSTWGSQGARAES